MTSDINIWALPFSLRDRIIWRKIHQSNFFAYPFMRLLFITCTLLRRDCLIHPIFMRCARRRCWLIQRSNVGWNTQHRCPAISFSWDFSHCIQAFSLLLHPSPLQSHPFAADAASGQSRHTTNLKGATSCACREWRVRGAQESVYVCEVLQRLRPPVCLPVTAITLIRVTRSLPSRLFIHTNQDNQTYKTFAAAFWSSFPSLCACQRYVSRREIIADGSHTGSRFCPKSSSSHVVSSGRNASHPSRRTSQVTKVTSPAMCKVDVWHPATDDGWREGKDGHLHQIIISDFVIILQQQYCYSHSTQHFSEKDFFQKCHGSSCAHWSRCRQQSSSQSGESGSQWSWKRWSRRRRWRCAWNERKSWSRG